MAVVVLGGTLHGLDAIPIQVEVDLLRRLPRVSVVGLAAHAVQESAERVRSAIVSTGLEFPKQRIVINLAPADVKKDGTAFDLTMALGILAADGQIPAEALGSVLAVGELSLSGELRRVPGALSLGWLAQRLGRTLILPPCSAEVAALVPGADVRRADTLAQVIDHLRGVRALPIATGRIVDVPESSVDLAEVRGQALARRGLEIAAAGAHHVTMWGAPGVGKSMLARRLPTILPPLTLDEALETTRIHSVAGLLGDDPQLLRARPFRAPHHSITVAGMIGDRRLRPGEISLAHHGVLFLDEATEFSRAALEVLRTPLEEGTVRLVRAEGAVEYPAAITLVMASNPCPCGRGRGTTGCGCHDHEIRTYRRRLSGPILDRIDLHIELEAIGAYAMLAEATAESSAVVRERVTVARERQRARGQQVPNAMLGTGDLDRFGRPVAAATDLLRDAVDRMGLSGRVAARLLKVARTIADLAGADRIAVDHLAEALAFRPTDGTT